MKNITFHEYRLFYSDFTDRLSRFNHVFTHNLNAPLGHFCDCHSMYKVILKNSGKRFGLASNRPKQQCTESTLMEALLLPKYIRLDCPIVNEVTPNDLGNKTVGYLDAHSADLYASAHITHSSSLPLMTWHRSSPEITDRRRNIGLYLSIWQSTWPSASSQTAPLQHQQQHQAPDCIFSLKQNVKISGGQQQVTRGPNVAWIPTRHNVGHSYTSWSINGILANLSSILRLFANDCLLYQGGRSTTRWDTPQPELDRLVALSHTLGTEFYVAKCNILTVTHKVKH